MRHNTFRAYSIILIFTAIIAFFFLNEQFSFIKDIESFENRAMAEKPEFNVELLDPFPAKFEPYYNDHFSLRASMIRLFNIYNVLILKKSPVPDKVIIGSNGWLYNADIEQDIYIGKERFTDEQLKAFKLELEYRQKYLAERNCKFYVLIAPVKAVIHPENMPFEEFRLNNQSRGEQLINYINTNSSVKIVNIYDIFRSEKNRHPMYYKIDNHWNAFGALYANNALITAIKKDFPDIPPLPREAAYNIKKEIITLGNTQQMLGNITIYNDTNYIITLKKGDTAKDVEKAGYTVTHGFPYPWGFEVDREIKNSKLPKALIISDSFGGMIFPYVAENFSRTVKIFDSWQYKLNEEIVDAEKPDVCILIMHETILHNFLDFQARLSPK